MTDFEKTLLAKVDTMNESLSALTDRLTSFEGETKQALTELSGKMKGNHDLLQSEIKTYVAKDTCENHREKQGLRVRDCEDRVTRLESTVTDLLDHESRREEHVSERVTAWLPSVLILISIIGGIIWVAVNKGGMP